MRFPWHVLLAIGAALGAPPRFAVAALPRGGPDEPRPGSSLVQVIDYTQRLDINNTSMVVTNTGSFAWEKLTGNAGLEFPKGSGRTAVFAAGLWLGARVGFDTRVTVSEYSDEYQPGSMVGGFPDNPNRLEYKVYKLNRAYSSVAERDAALADYNAGALPHGAPPVSLLPDGTLGITGDQMLWAVYNDAEPVNHNNDAGGTAPLGVEVQQTTFAFSRPGPLGNTVFIRFKILNRGFNQLDDMYLGVWLDPDVGGFTDDVTGCDPSRSLGYCYNAYNLDAQYGGAPPAVGVDLIQGLLDPATNARLGLTAFATYINGTDPTSFVESYNYMRGYQATGDPIVDPTTGLATSYFHSGDPLAGTGWLDTAPSDKRMFMGTGPIAMAPGQQQEILIALIVGQGGNDLGSLARLKCDEPAIQAFAEAGFSGPEPGFAPCQVVTHCPRSASYWETQCATRTEISAQQLEEVAACVDRRSAALSWLALPPLSALCSTLGPGATDPRARAKREYAALQASACMAELRLVPTHGDRIYLSLGRPVACTNPPASVIADLVAPARLEVGQYLNLNPAHPRPIEGVNWGGQGFGGGAGSMSNFFGSRLDPLVHPDSFPTVEIRFDHTQTQLAYRFLRLETQSGAAPVIGRGYPYGGFHPVDFTCWDVTHNVQLDVAFVERAVTDDFGTILDPSFQPPTFDSTWGPDDSPVGGREYLFVTSRPYAGAPRPELAQDGAPLSGDQPYTYVLWSRLRSAFDVIDDGDRFRFMFAQEPVAAIDARLIELEGQSLDDPAVQAAYADIIACLEGVNGGVCGAPVDVRADAGDDVTAECSSPGGTPVRLDGSRSQGEGLIYFWSAPGVTFDAPGSPTPTGLFPLGTTTVALDVSGGQASRDLVDVTVVDTRAPSLAVVLSPSLLWPPNHKLASIHAEVVAQDACDGVPQVALVSITSSEPDVGTGPDDVPGDIQDADLGGHDMDFALRSERDDEGGGRTYVVCYEARDASGHSARQCVSVGVPHDQRGRASLSTTLGGWSLTIHGGPRMAVRDVAAGSVSVGGEGFDRVRASDAMPRYADVDADRAEDVVFSLAGDPTIVAGGASLYARWEAAGQGYLAAIAAGGVTEVPGEEAPRVFQAHVWPSPGTEGTTIRFALPRPGHVRLAVYDVAGHQVARLVDDWRPAGRYGATFVGRTRSQLYLYRLDWEGRSLKGKFAIVR